MPRGKKATARAKMRHPPRGARFDASTPLSGSGTSSPRGGLRGFTLQDEAFNTERHHSFWSNDQRLRHSKISFVSAGPSRPTEESPKEPESGDDLGEPESALAEMTLNSPHSEEMIVDAETEEEAEEDHQEESHTNPEPVPSSVFFIDTVGDMPRSTGLPAPQTRVRSPSPALSNSSEEVILFRGRNRMKGDALSPSSVPRTFVDPIANKTAANGAHERGVHETTIKSKATQSKPPKESADSSPGEFEALLPKSRSKHRRQGRTIDQEEEDALIADYIANTEGGEDVAAWGTSNQFHQRPLGFSGHDSAFEDTESPTDRPARSKFTTGDNWDRSYICDFDDLSTSDGVMGDLEAVLSKRDRSSGVQYLVVWSGQSVDEARWVPTTTLTTADAVLLIAEFEEEEKLAAEYQANDDDDSSESEDMDTDGEMDEEDDDDLWEKRADHLTDEQIARLLAKQEELGMGSNELLLMDDAADTDEDDDLPRSSTHYNSFELPSRKSGTKARGAKRPRGDFPAAAALADAYDGFDVMDFERPSLKKKPKGRKGKLPFDVSDSDMEAAMQATYENDRARKKERKQQRELLRSEGLLGTKSGKPNLKDKYREGMGINAVKDEIKAFLISRNTTLALPPMDKADRKVVHELANAFNLKSKSAGQGNKRFPVLYRTSRTLPYVERTFDAVETRISRRFLPRMDVGGKKFKAKGGGQGGFASTSASYRDGDIVGASAPELGAENRGRAMLEKMGWSSGTALGALNNKGILQPVSHVVKTTKAGLG